MPAYANEDGKVVLFFQDSGKFNYRYSTLGFQDAANLDDGDLWPVAYALQKWSPDRREAGRRAGEGCDLLTVESPVRCMRYLSAVVRLAGAAMHIFKPPSAPRGLVLLAPVAARTTRRPVASPAPTASPTADTPSRWSARSTRCRPAPVLRPGPLRASLGTRVGLPLLARLSRGRRRGAAVLADGPVASARWSLPRCCSTSSPTTSRRARLLPGALRGAARPQDLVENPGGHLDLPRTTVEESASWLDRS